LDGIKSCDDILIYQIVYKATYVKQTNVTAKLKTYCFTNIKIRGNFNTRNILKKSFKFIGSNHYDIDVCKKYFSIYKFTQKLLFGYVLYNSHDCSVVRSSSAVT